MKNTTLKCASRLKQFICASNCVLLNIERTLTHSTTSLKIKKKNKYKHKYTDCNKMLTKICPIKRWYAAATHCYHSLFKPLIKHTHAKHTLPPRVALLLQESSPSRLKPHYNHPSKQWAGNGERAPRIVRHTSGPCVTARRPQTRAVI